MIYKDKDKEAKRMKWKRLWLLPLLLALLTGCHSPRTPREDDGRLSVVTTLFPQYDFARQIAGEYADVTLLLPPGTESHTFEPTPSDIASIEEADLFVYTGDAMEPWAGRILETVSVRSVDLSACVPLHEEEHDHGHDHGGVDPHIWTSPQNARLMVHSLTDALCEADGLHAQEYRRRADAYDGELALLDGTFREITDGADRRELIFGGRFALHYFTEEYGLTPLSAYDSCSEEAEPSARAVARLIDHIREERIPVVYYEELTDPRVARVICEETGAKLLLFHSCHNVSREELRQGVTYVSLMRQNAEHLREGLYGWL